MIDPLPRKPGDRILFLDGLRGVAAMGVVICHASSLTIGHESVRSSVPAGIRELFRRGDLGVAVFFVLSGFVIANSLRDMHVTSRSVGRFILRRSLRLDPPYWLAGMFAIAVTTVIAVLAGAFPPPGLPGWGVALAHLAYLQGWLGLPHIIRVFWTLCIEVQFYLAFVVLLALSQRWRLPPGVVALGPFIASLFVTPHGNVPRVFDREVSLVPHIAMFYLGVTACYACRARGWLWFACGIIGVTVRLVCRSDEFLAAGLATSVFIVVAYHCGRVGAVLCGPAIQFLGAISYSLYLVHWPVEHFFSLVVFRLLGRTAAAGWTAMPLVILASLMVAYLFFLAIERPSLAFSKRIPR